MSPLISIIIPVYNVEHLLERCLNSIICQTCTDFELILIDDGSTDNSGLICDSYKEKDNRIRVIHQYNEGSSSARNKGISIAQGTYIVFIDSDDWVEPNYLQTMLDCMITNHADMVISAFYLDNNDNSIIIHNKPESLEKETILNGFFSNKLHAGLWNKMLVRKAIINNHILFPKYNYYEDMVFSTEYTIASTSIAYCEYPTYHYVYNHLSMTNSCDENKRYKLFQDFANNIIYIQNLPYIKHLKVFNDNLFFLVNFNKKGIIKNVSSKKILNLVMNIIPESINFRNIHKISDFLLFISSRYHIYKPFKLYFTIRSLFH